MIEFPKAITEVNLCFSTRQVNKKNSNRTQSMEAFRLDLPQEIGLQIYCQPASCDLQCADLMQHEF